MPEPDKNDEKVAALPAFAEWTAAWKKGDKAAAEQAISKVAGSVEPVPSAQPMSSALSIGEPKDRPNRIELHPVDIALATSAPIDTYAEFQTLYFISKNMVATLLVESEQKGKISHALPTWMKEARTLLSEIHKMSAGFQEKVALKKLDIATAMIASSSELKDKFKIEMIKELEQLERLAKKPKVVNL